MAKITFSKLGLKPTQEITVIDIGGSPIEIKNYLSLENKINTIASIIEKSYDDKNYVNWIKVEVLTHLELVYAYTNITFTDKQKEDVYKTYDCLRGSGALQLILDAIPTEEKEFVLDKVYTMIEEIYTQKNSALGIFESIVADYSNLDLDATKIQEKLQNKENMEFLGEVMNKLG